MRVGDPGEKLADFAAHPWPSDARKRPSGQLDLRAFPNPTESSTLEDYVKIIGDETTAYSTSAAMYLSFTAPLDLSSLPPDPLAATVAGTPLELVDIDETSPARGTRHPIRTRFSEKATIYLPANTLTVMPPYGIPLEPDRKYALIARTGLRANDGAKLEPSVSVSRSMHEECLEDAPPRIAELFAPLRKFFADTGQDVDQVLGATVFTTQGVLREIRQLGEIARAEPAMTLAEGELVALRPDVIYLKGVVQMPSFQSGKLPYASIGDGGAIAKNAAGEPVVDHYERTRVGISIPRRRTTGHTIPEKGWPVVLYSHGTGGDYTSTFDSAVADVLGRNGIAVVGYDQTLHGPRDPTGSNPDLTFFNLFNPIAARDNIRQGTADLTAMTTFLASGALMFPKELTGEDDVHFDPDRIAFLGHSQGSLVAAPWIASEPRVKAVVFSGLGAILTITLLERKDIVDFKGLLESLLKLPAEEPLEEMHPVLNLIQTFIDPADPISYASSYLADPPAQRDILQVEGFLDFASPARGQEAFSVAARIPLVSPQHRLPPAAELVGPAAMDAPQESNVNTKVGPATYGLIQYPEETHFPIFENADANARYVEFLRSALFDGRARIIESQ
jgi:pimeloyl-ACP methyl ester carboxylesterase